VTTQSKSYPHTLVPRTPWLYPKPLQHFPDRGEHGERGDRMVLAHLVDQAAALPQEEDVCRLYRRPGPARAGAQWPPQSGLPLHGELPSVAPRVRRARLQVVSVAQKWKLPIQMAWRCNFDNTHIS
jgi:hypothetical protein